MADDDEDLTVVTELSVVHGPVALPVLLNQTSSVDIVLSVHEHEDGTAHYTITAGSNGLGMDAQTPERIQAVLAVALKELSDEEFIGCWQGMLDKHAAENDGLSPSDVADLHSLGIDPYTNHQNEEASHDG